MALTPGVRPSQPVRLLVVDDQADVRFLVRAYVDDDADVEVVAEADGLEAALEALDRSAPDVVLLDALMPKIDGFEAAPLLKARRPEVRIVLLTGLDEVTLRERLADVPAIDAWVSKDHLDRVVDTVRAATGG